MKKLKLTLIIMIIAIIAFGCTTQDTVEKTNEPIEEHVEETKNIVIIEPTSKLEVVDTLTTLDEFEFDFDDDGEMEIVKLLTAAEKTSDGEIAWDDGQKWMLVVQDTDKDYVLVDEYVQLGIIDFNVFLIEDTFYISTLSPRTASLTLNIYEYDKENDNFIMTTPYNASGNVNMLKTSEGY